MRSVGITHARILTCQDERVCDACRALEGKVVRLKGRLPLPACRDCRCIYLAIG